MVKRNTKISGRNVKKKPAKKSVKKKSKKTVKQKTKRPVKTAKAAGKTKRKLVNKTKKKATKKVGRKNVRTANRKTSKKTEKKKKKFSSPNKVESSNIIEKRALKDIRLRRHPVEVSLKIIIALSFLGLIVASYLIYMHYKPEAATICTFGEKLNCDVVNKSAYAKFMGIPNAIIGALGYLYFIIVSLITLKGYDLSKVAKRIRPKHLNFLVMLFAVFGWLFSMYLLYVEIFILHAFCIFCLTSLGIITIIMMTAMYSYRQCMKCRDIMHRIHLKACGKMCRYCE